MKSKTLFILVSLVVLLSFSGTVYAQQRTDYSQFSNPCDKEFLLSIFKTMSYTAMVHSKTMTSWDNISVYVLYGDDIKKEYDNYFHGDDTLAIVYQDGTEVARIFGSDWSTIRDRVGQKLNFPGYYMNMGRKNSILKWVFKHY